MGAPSSTIVLPAIVYVLGFEPASTLIVVPAICLTSVKSTRKGCSTARMILLLSSVQTAITLGSCSCKLVV